MTDLFLKLFNMSVSAGWIVLAILLVRLIFRKAPKWLNVLLWGLVGVRLALPFSIKSILSLIPSTNTLPQEIAVSPEPVIESGVPVVNEIVNPVISEGFKPSVAESVNPMQVLLFIAAVVWVIGITVMLTYTVVSYIKVYLRIREGVAINHNTVICDRINTPFIMGIIKPKIYLPSAMEERYKEYVISHEEAHIKRLDYLWKPLGFAFLTVYWFNPLLWVAYILLCRDIEFACDERVILQHDEEYKALYSEALLNCSIKKVKVNINPIAFGEVSVKERILNIFSYKKPPLYITVIAVILVVCMCAGFLTDPVDKKKADKKPTNVDTVTSQTEDTTNTSSEPTESVVSTPEESKPTESTPTVSSKEETVSSTPSKPQDTVTSKPIDLEIYDPNYEVISQSNCKLKAGTEQLKFSNDKIKKAYLRMRKFNDLEYKNIRLQVLRLFNDNSIAFVAYHLIDEADIKEKTTYNIGEFEYSCIPRTEISIYKDGEAFSVKDAYEKGKISKEILEEFYEIYIKNEEKYIDVYGFDFIGSLDFKTAKKIKEDYAKKHGIETFEVKFQYLNTLSNGAILIRIESMAHEYLAWDHWDLIVLGEYKYAAQYPFLREIYKDGKFYSLENAYKNGIITDDMLSELFVKTK